MNETTLQNPRELRGIELAKRYKLTKENGVWSVPSASKSIKYTVDLRRKQCTCPDYEIRRVICKHIFAVKHREELLIVEKLTYEEIVNYPNPEPPRPTYPQNWKAYNQSQTTEKIEFQKLLSMLCKGIGEPSQTNGRPRLPLEDMIFSCVFKVYSTFSGRRFTTDLSEATQKGFISKTPHFNSVLRYFDKEMLTPYLEMMIAESSLPLAALEENFAIDASGLSLSQGFTWHYAKYESPRLVAKDDWLKIHICTGTRTNVVTAVKVTASNHHDHHYFAPLLEDTKENFQMRSISADKAYLSNHNLNVSAMNDVLPFIAFKSSSTEGKKDTVWNKLYHFYSLHKEKYLKEYHRRSNVESTFAMIKAKFNGSVRAKNKTSQKNEALCKILAHNLCCLIQSMNEFDVSAEFWKEVTLH